VCNEKQQANPVVGAIILSVVVSSSRTALASFFSAVLIGFASLLLIEFLMTMTKFVVL